MSENQTKKQPSKWAGVYCPHSFIKKAQISSGAWLCELPSGSKFFLPDGAFVFDLKTGEEKIIALKGNYIKVFKDEYNETFGTHVKLEEIKIPILNLFGMIKMELNALETEENTSESEEQVLDSSVPQEDTETIDLDQALAELNQNS